MISLDVRITIHDGPSGGRTVRLETEARGQKLGLERVTLPTDAGNALGCTCAELVGKEAARGLSALLEDLERRSPGCLTDEDSAADTFAPPRGLVAGTNPEVRILAYRFAESIALKLREREDRYGVGRNWIRPCRVRTSSLVDHAEDEVHELLDEVETASAVGSVEAWDKVAGEAVDVAALALMVWDRALTERR